MLIIMVAFAAAIHYNGCCTIHSSDGKGDPAVRISLPEEIIFMRKMIISIVAIVSIAGIAITALAISDRY